MTFVVYYQLNNTYRSTAVPRDVLSEFVSALLSAGADVSEIKPYA